MIIGQHTETVQYEILKTIRYTKLKVNLKRLPEKPQKEANKDVRFAIK
jgi:hypothetical protein